MSSEAVSLPGAVAQRRAAPFDEEVYGAALRLLRGGAVCFKTSSRVKARLIPWWKRGLYVLICREAPESLRVPPKPAMQLEVWTDFAAALGECKAPDDQILVMPLNRTCSRERLDVAVECRPNDPEDGARTNALRAVFAGEGAGANLRDVSLRLERLKSRVREKL